MLRVEHSTDMEGLLMAQEKFAGQTARGQGDSVIHLTVRMNSVPCWNAVAQECEAGDTDPANCLPHSVRNFVRVN